MGCADVQRWVCIGRSILCLLYRTMADDLYSHLEGDMAFPNEAIPEFEFDAGIGDQDAQPAASPERGSFLDQVNADGSYQILPRQIRFLMRK